MKEQNSGLPRVLGLWDIVSIVVGGVIGSGIFLVPRDITRAVGSPLLMMAVWAVGGLLSLFGALTFAELGAAYPQAGGMYVYLREAYGPLPSFLFGWTLFLVIDSGAIATLAVAFSSIYLPQFIPLSSQAAKLAAIGLIAYLVIINFLGTLAGAVLQNILTIIKFSALALMCAAIFILAPGRVEHFVQPAPPRLSLGLLSAFGVGLIASLWAYKGWEGATYSAGETKKPERNLPLGLIIGTLIIMGIYIVANLAYLYLFSAAEIASSERIAAQAMNAVLGPWGAMIIALVILLSITGAANQNFLCSPRVYFAMAKDGLFFKQVASVHRTYLTPHVSILALGAWSIVLVLFFGTFERLFTYVVFGQWLFFGLTAAAVIVLRIAKPGLPRPYKTLGYPVTPVFFILSALFISVNTLIQSFRESIIGLIIIALGLPVYFAFQIAGEGSKPRPA